MPPILILFLAVLVLGVSMLADGVSIDLGQLQITRFFFVLFCFVFCLIIIVANCANIDNNIMNNAI